MCGQINEKNNEILLSLKLLKEVLILNKKVVHIYFELNHHIPNGIPEWRERAISFALLDFANYYFTL